MADQAQRKREAQDITGVSNVAYDLMAALYNKLEGIAAMEEYKLDADEENDTEARDLFDQLIQQDVQYVDQLRKLLVSRMS